MASSSPYDQGKRAPLLLDRFHEGLEAGVGANGLEKGVDPCKEGMVGGARTAFRRFELATLNRLRTLVIGS